MTKLSPRGRTLWPASILLGSIALSACASVAQPGATDKQLTAAAGGLEAAYQTVSPAELNEMLAKQDFFFVNVHVPYEGAIPGTDAFIPFDQVGDQLAKFPQDKSATILVYCRSGSMSAIAAQTLVNAGYTNVFDLEGGFRAWKALGYPFAE